MGKAGCWLTPMARLQKRMQAAVTTGTSRTTGLPCAMAYGLYVISPGTGLIAPVIRALVACCGFSTSTGMPGPHDFAVRNHLVRPRYKSAAT